MLQCARLFVSFDKKSTRIMATNEIAHAVATTSTEHTSSIHIALAPEHIGSFLGVPITSTLIMSWVIMALLAIASVLIGRSLKIVPGKVQTVCESLIEFVYGYVVEVLESEKLARLLLPLLLTLFLFIFTANLLEFTPGIGSIGFTEKNPSEFIPLLRSMNTDLNVTLALAIISFVVIEVIGVRTLGALTYAKKFFNFSSPLNFAVGIIELFSELARLISFSFRLFGNVLAGEVLIAVVIFFLPYLAPVPMMLFETFVGFIQAAIFALLTLFFVKIAITKPH